MLGLDIQFFRALYAVQLVTKSLLKCCSGDQEKEKKKKRDTEHSSELQMPDFTFVYCSHDEATTTEITHS